MWGDKSIRYINVSREDTTIKEQEPLHSKLHPRMFRKPTWGNQLSQRLKHGLVRWFIGKGACCQAPDLNLTTQNPKVVPRLSQACHGRKLLTNKARKTSQKKAGSILNSSWPAQQHTCLKVCTRRHFITPANLQSISALKLPRCCIVMSSEIKQSMCMEVQDTGHLKGKQNPPSCRKLLKFRNWTTQKDSGSPCNWFTMLLPQ